MVIDAGAYAEGRKYLAALLAKGWSCPGRGKDVVRGCIPAEGWRSPDGREGINMFDALVEEGFVDRATEIEVRRDTIRPAEDS